jgi:hypothetical protein
MGATFRCEGSNLSRIYSRLRSARAKVSEYASREHLQL